MNIVLDSQEPDEVFVNFKERVLNKMSSSRVDRLSAGSYTILSEVVSLTELPDAIDRFLNITKPQDDSSGGDKAVHRKLVENLIPVRNEIRTFLKEHETEPSIG